MDSVAVGPILGRCGFCVRTSGNSFETLPRDVCVRSPQWCKCLDQLEATYACAIAGTITSTFPSLFLGLQMDDLTVFVLCRTGCKPYCRPRRRLGWMWTRIWMV